VNLLKSSKFARTVASVAGAHLNTFATATLVCERLTFAPPETAATVPAESE
jgi:hypothetical protein